MRNYRSIIIIFSLAIFSLISSNVSANYWAPPYSNESGIPALIFLFFLNLPLNMLSIIVGIIILKKCSITVVKSGNNVLFFILGLSIFCTIIGAITDFSLLYESKHFLTLNGIYYYHDVLTFNFLNWTLAVLLIMLSFSIPLFFWTKNLKIAVIIPSTIGILNILVWIIIIKIGNEREMGRICFGYIPMAIDVIAIIMLIIVTKIKSNEYKRMNSKMEN